MKMKMKLYYICLPEYDTFVRLRLRLNNYMDLPGHDKIK